MKDYFQRNSPIFYIGIFTIILFLAVIFAGSSTPTQTPTMEKINDEDLYTNQNPVIGENTARVTVVEFSDYNCPYCVSVNPILKATVDNNPGKIKLIIRQLPLPIPGHETSKEAALAATAANKFGKFKEMHNEIYNLQDKSRENLVRTAEKIGINRDEFQKALESDEVKQIVEDDIKAAEKLKITGTPTIFINGKAFNFSQDLTTTILAEMNKMYPQN
jgi:protein-disulfide isomerase